MLPWAEERKIVASMAAGRAARDKVAEAVSAAHMYDGVDAEEQEQRSARKASSRLGRADTPAKDSYSTLPLAPYLLEHFSTVFNRLWMFFPRPFCCHLHDLCLHVVISVYLKVQTVCYVIHVFCGMMHNIVTTSTYACISHARILSFAVIFQVTKKKRRKSQRRQQRPASRSQDLWIFFFTP